ncbi:hypothetical protein KIH39_22815 [Telmatocola sphagniphila]|uniref:DUF5666 domain-containing protein n=1 Tax=Telmatocola sphagniphila TaxID=1123043 RepID=A0A8E6EXT8_9BACT|nr:hypothetical protein [Telmatocola sphagniphila]QVL31646.1 hypothetical protein KIH39_22815 [Telmatocola sphagniphila]
MQSFFVRWFSLVLIGAVVSAGPALTADPPAGGSIKVEVEGTLGTILRPEKTDSVTATVIASGGEFVIDTSASKTAREELVWLAEKYIKPGSTVVISPQLKVRGRLEFRTTQIVNEQGKLSDGPKTWVLVADGIAVVERRGK